jgi:protocatechuate 3,4-dioxygenase beta subunit
MMRRFLVWGVLTAGILAAQTAATNAAVSGVVKDKVSGRPLANYTVSTWLRGQQKDVASTTDPSGRYKLMDLPPGAYRITANNAQRQGFGQEVARHVAVNGSDVENVDFLVLLPGTISGKVVDENKEPVPGVSVSLVQREYFLGNVGYYYAFPSGRTDDQGEYTITSIEPGRPYYLLADKVDYRLPAHSETPLNPKLRKRVPVRTWYPASALRESAEALSLQPGEAREGVDIEMKKSPSYCVEGTVFGPTGAAALHFSIEAMQPSSGQSGSGGSFRMAPSGMTAADGQFRICDLYPGVYRLSAQDGDFNSLKFHGTADIAVTDQDLEGVRVNAVPGKSLEGEVVWDADPPATPVTNKVFLSVVPLFRTGYLGGRYDVPGTFTVDGVFPDEYAVQARFNAPGAYVKDVTFSDRSVRYEPLRPAAAMNGSGLRVAMAHDGGTIAVQVSDKDGNPAADLFVLTIPAEVRSEAEVAARIEEGETDQAGQYTTPTLAPGKYYVVAIDKPVDRSPETIGRLWRARNRYQEVDLQANGSAQVKIEPGKIE